MLSFTRMKDQFGKKGNKMKELGIRIWQSNIAIAAMMLPALLTLMPKSGRADLYCHISDPQDATLNVRDSPGGSVVNRLPNEMVVRADDPQSDAQGGTWVNVEGSYQGKYQALGWVFRKHLRCVETEQFPREHPSVQVLRAAGIAPEESSKTLPISCDVVPNGWGVSISNELYKAYRQRGFSKNAVCLGLGGWGVYFDPETGKRLDVYELPQDPEMGLRPQVHPFWLPDCYKQVQILNEGKSYMVSWRPTGCKLRYHPTTGLPITKPDLVELTAGGPAGGGVDEDNRSSTITEERLRRLVLGK